MAGSTSTRLLRAAASALAVLGLLAGAPAAAANPNALWDIVNGQCVPHQLTSGDPSPCALVDVLGGYAVLKDLVGATQFLLIPTERIPGIESPRIVAADAPNYFADAWRARTFVEERAGRGLLRDWISLSINSAADRTQSQMHIHIDCVRADVRHALAANAGAIGPSWAAMPVPLAGQPYRAMAVSGEDLDAANPLRLLAADLPAGQTMASQSLVVVGATDTDGRPGFVLLAGDTDAGSGHGEDLQDHTACPPQPEAIGK